MPIGVTLGFTIFSPVSPFRGISIYWSILGSFGNFIYSAKDDLIEWARKDTPLGLEIRECYKNIAIVDPNMPTMKEYTDRTIRLRDNDTQEINHWKDFYKYNDD